MTIDERFDRLDGSVERLSKYTADLKEAVLDRLTTLENRLDATGATLTGIEMRLPAFTKAMHETGALATELVKRQAELKASDTDLAARVAKLEQAISKLLPAA
jgi:hypothetical protein